MKEWLDKLIDTLDELRSIQHEHGASRTDDKILIYSLKTCKSYDGRTKYGFLDLAKAVGANPVCGEYFDNGTDMHYEISFEYRGYKIFTYEPKKPKGVK